MSPKFNLPAPQRRVRNRRGSVSPLMLGAIAIVLIIILGGWYYVKNQATPTAIGKRNVVLRIHGSNTIGSELGPALVIAYLKSIGGTNIRTTPKQKEESEIVADVPGEPAPVIVDMQAHGSATAFADLIAGKTDIGMASRRVEQSSKNDEVGKASAAGLGDLTSAESEHVIGLDGVAVIVNSSNPVKSLTTGQIAAIFSGEIANWSGVNGNAGPIKVYARDDKSGTWDTFRNLVLKDKQLISSATRLEDSKELSNRVANDESAIGFIGLPYLLNSKALAVFETQKQGGATTPLYPNVFSVRTEEYPLSRRLYFYNAAKPASWTQKFTAFALSKEGQAVVADNKFVSLTPCSHCETAPKQDTAEAPPRYRLLTRGKDRISLNFFFRSGSADLDTRAIADIGRVVDLLRDLNYSGSGIVLMGFADNVGGNSPGNMALSRKRAQAVADQFLMHGIHPEFVEPIGSAMPIASNDTPAGREKNRRVEIWVKKG